MVKDKVLEGVRVTHGIKHMTASRCFSRGPRYQEAEDSWACRVEVGDPIRSHEAGWIRQQRTGWMDSTGFEISLL